MPTIVENLRAERQNTPETGRASFNAAFRVYPETLFII
jgi:hypothetical protein